MTEIVNNNNGMAFDLLETGNSASTTSGNGKFNSFFSDIDNKENSDPESMEVNDKKLSSLEETISEIINILKNSELNIENNILTDIAFRLRGFFDTFNPVETAGGTQTTNIKTNAGNDNFLQLMRFLDKIKNILNLNANTDQSRNQEINGVLDKITPRLNEQIKAYSKRNVDLTNGVKIATLNKKSETVSQNSIVRPNEANAMKSSNLNFTEISTNNTNSKAPDSAEVIQSTLRDDKIKSKVKHKLLDKVIDNEKSSDAGSNGINKMWETKSELMPEQASSNSGFGKNLFTENNSVKQGIASNAKVETNNSLNQENIPKAPLSKNQTSNGLSDNLNMLSKSWGDKLIEKIEKSRVDGIEKLEISLSPKSLGKLNVTINMQDAIAKISIIAESSSVAALLGEAEAKLSQMMEATGLKLASLQTLTQQFGQNKKGKEQPQKLALQKKKDNINDPDNTGRKINNEENHKEGLNLIA